MKNRSATILLIIIISLSLLATLGTVAASMPGNQPNNVQTSATVPQIDLNGRSTPGINYHTNYTENIGLLPIVDTQALTLTSTDDLTLTTATITLLNLPDGDQELLKIDTSGTNLVATYNSNNGVMTLTAPSGRDTLANFEKALRTICYSNSSNNPDSSSRTIQFVISDGTNSSPTAEATVTINPINDAPLLDNNSPLHFADINEDDSSNNGNQVAELLAADQPRIADVDGPLEGVALTAADNSNGKWQFKTTSNWFDVGNVTPQTAVLLDSSTRLRFIPTHNYSGSASLTLRAWDQSDGRTSGSAGVDTRNSGGTTPFSNNLVQAIIIVEPQNDPPIIDLNGPAAGSKYQTIYTEDSDFIPIVDAEQLTVSDVDSAQLTAATVHITNQADGSQELLTAQVTLPQINVNYNAQAGELQLTGPATAAQFQQVLRSIVYKNESQHPNNSDRTIEFTISDGNASSIPAISTVAINRINDAPILNTSTPFTLTPIDEDETNSLGNLVSTIIASGGNDPITDVDGDLEGVAIIGLDDSNGRWQYRLSGSTSWVDFTAVSSISATLLSPDERIRFLPDSNYSGSASFTFRAWDRSDNSPVGATNINTNLNGGTAAFSAAQASATITILSVNDIPILDLNGAAPGQEYTADFDEGFGPISIVSPTLTLIDVDNTNIQSAHVQISNLLDPGQENLAITGADGLTVNFNPASGSLTIAGLASKAQYQTILRTITYNNLSQAPTDNSQRLIIFTVTDESSGVSEPVTSTVRINPVNNVPVINSFTITATEDIPYPFSLNLFNQHFADPDGDDITELKIATLPANGTLQLASVPVNTGQTIPAAQIGQLRFVPAANWHGTTSFDWNGKDDEVYPANGGTVTLIVNAENDAPTLTDVAKTGPEDSRLWFTIADFAASFVDIDGDALTHVQIKSLPGTGILRFGETAVSINDIIPRSSLGQISFLPAANWTGIISFDWNGSDGELTAEAVASVMMTITAVNDPPTLSNIEKLGSEDNLISFTPADFAPGFQDIEGDHLQKLEITSLPTHGTLHFNGNPVGIGQEINSNNLTTLTFIPDDDWFGTTSFGWNGSDGEFYAPAEALVQVTITAVNDPPTLDLNGGSPGTSYSAAFSGQNNTIRIVSTSLSLVDIDSQQILSVTATLQNRPDGNSEQLSATTQGTAISLSYNNNSGTLTLSGSDTIANYQQVLRTLSYSNSSTTPTITNRTVTIAASDGTNSSEQVESHITPPRQLYLPILARSFKRSDEPNNNCQQAYSLNTNTSYQFFANDQEDWYKFHIPQAGAIIIELTNFAPQGDGQLIAYHGTCPANLTILGQNGDFSTTKIINLGVQPAGTYFIRVFNGSSPNTTNPYTLQIRY